MPHNLADILKQLKIEVTQDPNICARKLRHRNPVLYFKIISSLRGGYKEAMFLLEHNLSSPPLCKICKSRPRSFNGKTYSNYCSIDCYRKDYIFEGNERKVDDKLDNSFGKYIIYGPGIKELTFNWEKL